MKRSLLVSLIIVSSAIPSLGLAQDTLRSPRRVARDSVRRIMSQRDTIGWIASSVAFRSDSQRVRFATDSAQWIPSRLAGQKGDETSSSGAAYAEHLFPPELIMRHQGRLRIRDGQRDSILREINVLQATASQAQRIRDGQRDSILREINVLQATASQAQWRIAEESQKLNDLLASERVNLQDVLSQADRVMTHETALKRAQLNMLVRLRNMLSPEQRAMLRGLRREN